MLALGRVGLIPVLGAMGKIKVIAVIILAITCQAMASTPVFFPPGKQLADSSAVLVAVPRSIACRVTSNDRLAGLVKANARVTWQVLIRWKGPLRVGDTFTSNESIVADTKPCFYNYNKPLLLYLSGKQPFKEVWGYELETSVDRLQELDAYSKRHGT
jgi:hypothetical protein